MNSRRQKQRRPSRGRRPGGGSESRDAILASARALFSERGFARVSLREIAVRAGVDAALIHHFFGSKEGLLQAVLELPFPPEALLRVVEGPIETAGERLSRFYLGGVFRHGYAAMASLLRSAATDAAAAEALRRLVESTLVEGLARALGSDPEARARAELFGALMVGLFVVRHLVGVEPLASMEDGALARMVAPIAQCALTGSVAQDAPPRARGGAPSAGRSSRARPRRSRCPP